MQHFLVIVDKYLPNPSSNGACAEKIVERLRRNGNEVTVLSVYNAEETQSSEHNICLNREKLKVTIFDKVFGYLQDRTLVKELYEEAKKIHSRKPVSKVLSVYRPIESVLCGRLLQRTLNIQNFPCFFDLPETTSMGGLKKKILLFNYKRLYKKLSAQNLVLVLKYYYDYFKKRGMRKENIKPIGIPNFEKNLGEAETTTEKIKIVYTGSFYEKIRNPQKVFEVLTNIIGKNIEIHLFSWGCENIVNEYKNIFKDQLCIHKRETAERIKEVLANADVLLNISNNSSLQVPGKIIEYFSTGKPVINFRFREDDSGNVEYEKYPMIYNVDLFKDVNSGEILEFLLSSKGKQGDIEKIQKQYEDCTPEYVAKILGG